MELTTKYSHYSHVKLAFGQYQNKRLAIRILSDTENDFTAAPIMVVTVNIPDAPLGDNEVIIKNWSENEGILHWLQQNRVVGPVLREIPTGYVMAQVCHLLIDPIAYTALSKLNSFSNSPTQ